MTGQGHPPHERRREAYRGGYAGRTEADWTAYLRRALRVDELAAAASRGLDIHEVAVSAGASAAHPDAALIALGIELEAAWEREGEAVRDCDARIEAATAAMPERPDCLTFREADHPFGLIQVHTHSEAMEGLAVQHGDITWMRCGPRKHQVLRDARAGERGWRDYGGKVPEMQPWPEAQARADEILGLPPFGGPGSKLVHRRSRDDGLFSGRHRSDRCQGPDDDLRCRRSVAQR